MLLHTDSLSHYGLDRVFRFAHESGMSGLEISVGADLDTQNAAYLKQLEKRHQIPVKAFSIHPEFEETHFRAFQLVAREFPETIIILRSASTMSYAYKKWLDLIVPKLVVKYRLKLHWANAPLETFLGVFPGRNDNTVAALREKGLMCLDIAALNTSKEDLLKTVELIGENLQHVHLSNFNQGQLYQLPMDGVLPVESFLNKLSRMPFKGEISLRVAPECLSEGQDEMVISKLRACGDFVAKFMGQKAATPQPHQPTPEQPLAPTAVQSTPEPTVAVAPQPIAQTIEPPSATEATPAVAMPDSSPKTPNTEANQKPAVTYENPPARTMDYTFASTKKEETSTEAPKETPETIKPLTSSAPILGVSAHI